MSVNFSPTNWIDNSQPAITASQLNRMEKGIKDCAEAFNQSSAVYNFKGTLDSYQELPNLGNEIGDTYHILNTGENFAWNGVEWFEINVSLNITPFTQDYIVEQGSSGIWTYRKWASGVAECWGIQTSTINSLTKPWPNSENAEIYYSEQIEGAIYPFTFFSAPVFQFVVGESNNLGLIPSVHNFGKNRKQVAPSLFLYSHLAYNYQFSIETHWSITGRWK